MNKEKISDDELWKLVQKGNSEAFEVFYERYLSFVYQQVFSRVNIKEESKDITQEIFIAMWEKKHQVKQNVFAYLYSTTRYQVINHLKGKNLRQKHQDVLYKIIDESRKNSLDASTPELNEVQAVLQKAITNLPPRMREIYLMSENQGLSIQDIVNQLEISPQTVKNQLQEARNRLRKSLKIFLGTEFILYIAILLWLR